MRHVHTQSSDYMVIVKSVQVDPNQTVFATLADHVFIDIKMGSDDDWGRIEIKKPKKGVNAPEKIDFVTAQHEVRWKKDCLVKVLKVYRGDKAKAIAEKALALGQNYKIPYRLFPGPNSNTFINYLIREIPELKVELGHNAFGRNYYPQLIKFQRTGSDRGYQMDSFLLGGTVCVKEGICLRLLHLELGISLFPLAIKLPFIPRLGFYDEIEDDKPDLSGEPLEKLFK